MFFFVVKKKIYASLERLERKKKEKENKQSLKRVN